MKTAEICLKSVKNQRKSVGNPVGKKRKTKSVKFPFELDFVGLRWRALYQITELTFTPVTEKKFGSQGVGKESEFPFWLSNCNGRRLQFSMLPPFIAVVIVMIWGDGQTPSLIAPEEYLYLSDFVVNASYIPYCFILCLRSRQHIISSVEVKLLFKWSNSFFLLCSTNFINQIWNYLTNYVVNIIPNYNWSHKHISKTIKDNRSII